MHRLLLLVCLTVAIGACASSGATPRPFPGAAAPPTTSGHPAATPVRPGSVGALVNTALEYTGAPYRNGGTDPSGFDCSGFVHYVFGRHGLEVPREVREQFRIGARVDRARLRPGDLVFFTTVAPGASHVGIAISSDEFVHAPSTRGVVRVERIDTSYWSRRFVGARRVG
jgi:cell wall-associated NlpC family hydrolase